ncbi:sulfite exporter TauE/SafE family protein [Nocardioides carbamazepini]|uniref:sulfite exporter TauE/SafE family protein n=1 Tax=Nocardioides carbamazepini TaxID=2854259 RepID=UPI00214A00B1|nr:sulfite exporter TauE/SafE family protein [Nocardioides carbamazepini]MCR1784796.1 sulfite exporter TauE/SafE family protein [Nocardioides carbamazepini]
MTLAVVLALALLVGVALGALGGGGSILTVPLLVYVAGLDPKQAIATSLLVVGVTSAVGALAHARARRIRWRTGLLFGAGGTVGALGGGVLGARVPGHVLLVGFALMMLATAVAMLREAREIEAADEPQVVGALVDGVVVGAVTGLVGAGGGFLVVPALVLRGGIPMSAAVGTSLVVIVMKSLAGFAGYVTQVSVPWGLAAGVTVAAVAGSVLGSRLAGGMSETRLRRSFGWFVLVVGSFVLLQEAAPPAWLAPGIAVLATVGCAIACWRVWSPRSRSSRPSRSVRGGAAPR